MVYKKLSPLNTIYTVEHVSNFEIVYIYSFKRQKNELKLSSKTII